MSRAEYYKESLCDSCNPPALADGSVQSHAGQTYLAAKKDLGRLTMRVIETIMEGMSLISRITGRTVI
jgi:hypothetical protein